MESGVEFFVIGEPLEMILRYSLLTLYQTNVALLKFIVS